MYIAKITLDNFRSFKGYGNKLTLNKGLNFFVGDNNTGKTTVLSAVNFITEKKLRSDVISNTASDDDFVAVALEIRGDFSSYITGDDSLKKYKDYVQTDLDGEFLLVQRSSKNEDVFQGKKTVELTIEKLRVFNPLTNQYENPTGVDTTFKNIFSTQFVWADDMPSDYMDFGSTKICGKLINAAASTFFKSSKWTNFETAHRKAFTEGEDSLTSAVNDLAKNIEKVIMEQYGDTKVSFSFSLPEAAGFIKSGNIVLDDGGVVTEAKAKGTGMQRALALALIQIYANVSKKAATGIPLIFLLDEPETFLHPRAQDKLLEALDTISSTNQIFISTHSPYLLKRFRKSNHSLFIFTKNKGASSVNSSVTLSTFGASSPTTGEINYFAFGVLSVEFHNELYGYIQAQKALGDDKFWNGKEFDSYLATKTGFDKNKQWHRSDKPMPPYSSTIATYVRDKIHHPENTRNSDYTGLELQHSTEHLLEIINNGI